MSENAEVNPAGESPQPPAEDKSANDRIRLLEAKNAELIVEKTAKQRRKQRKFRWWMKRMGFLPS